MTARYDEVAEVYEAAGDAYDGSAISVLLDLVGADPGPKALDLGCGHGPVARELARRGAKVTAIDISSQLIERARALTDADLEVDYLEGDASSAAVLVGETFDLIVSNFGLSDVDDLDGVFRNVARWLALGGRLVFSILHPCFGGNDRVSASWPTDGSYYDEGFWYADGELSSLRRDVGANHRMLSTYLNSLVAVGLALRTVREPRPEPEWASERPRAGLQPVYLVIESHWA